MLHVQVVKSSEWNQKSVIVFVPAPEMDTPDSPGREAGEILYLPEKKQVLVSLGVMKKITAETMRRAAGLAAKWLNKHNLQEIGLDLKSTRGYDVPFEDAVRAVVEGLILGAFRFEIHKTEKKDREITVNLLADDPKAIAPLVEAAVIAAEAVNLSRAWSHEPANIINPVTLAERTQELAQSHCLKCTVLDDKQLDEMGAGAIVAVGKASATPSRLIVLEYAGQTNKKPVVLVGKSITFDTGGYTIKNAEGIVGMKYDKCGGMTVIATLVAASRLKLKTPLVGIIAAAENAISGVAYRPNDILKTLSGKTVEIVSTDAEGRLVLCDALTYAQQNFQPRAMIDLATLTGGVVIALGDIRAGLFANNDVLAEALTQSGERTHERLWRLPMDEEYLEMLKSDDADTKNSTGIRKAHPIIGGIFLKQFVADEIPWAHLDIAGMATTDKEQPYCPKGGTGFGVRLLLDYLQKLG